VNVRIIHNHLHVAGIKIASAEAFEFDSRLF
jgi:hypothetical protein